MQLDLFASLRILFGSGFCTNGSGIESYPVKELDELNNVVTFLYLINLYPEHNLSGEPKCFLFGKD